MKIYLYNTDSTNNTINKVLTDEVEFDITFKASANSLRPSVRLQTTDLIKSNYAYIPDFERYYFIRDTSIQPNSITNLELEVDVLESFKEDILQSKAIVSRHTGANKYYDAGDYRIEERKTHKIYESDKTPEFKESLILVTIGG